MTNPPDYMDLLDLITELDNIEMIRIAGIAILNRREKETLDEAHREALNEALCEIISLTLAHNTKIEQASDEIADNIIAQAIKLTESGETVEIIHAMCGVNPTEETSTVNDHWIGYV